MHDHRKSTTNMTAPQMDPAAFAAFMAQQAAPQAPAAPAGYPQMPQGFPQVPQQYAPQMPQGYAPQGGYQPQQPAPQLAAGSLDDFFSQPSTGGGPALKFSPPNQATGQQGTTYAVQVVRAITNADIQQQTNPQNGQPSTYRDGRPKFVMKVPVKVLQANVDTTPYAEGAQWYVAGATRDELVQAMSEVGAPAGPPEAGAVIAITCTGTRSSGSAIPAKTWAVKYQRPGGAAAPTAPVEIPTQAAAPAPQAPAAAPVAPPAPSAAPADLSADQQALLAKLTGATS
jgi:hypothetical protein